jgi:hypothetical protein
MVWFWKANTKVDTLVPGCKTFGVEFTPCLGVFFVMKMKAPSPERFPRSPSAA